MNIDILMNTLKHGTVLNKYNEDGQVVGQEMRPPNKHMLEAARVIEHLLQQLNNNQHYMNQLQHERDEALQQLEHFNRHNVRGSNPVGQDQPNT